MKKLLIMLLCCFTLLAGCQSAPTTDSGSQAGDDGQQESADATDATEAGEGGAEDEPEEDASWQYVLEKGTLVIGLDDTFAPMGFREEDGTLVGFDIDLAEAVCEYLGVEAVFQPIQWSAKEMELSTKKIDCIWNGMSITDERIETMSLTRGYLNNRIIIMTVEGVEISSKEDLVGLSVGTQAESAALETIMQDPIYGELDIYEYDTYDEVIMDMDTGRIQVMIVDEVLGKYKNALRGEALLVPDVDFGDDLYAVGFRKGDDDLTAKVEEAIDAVIDSGDATAISEKWFGSDIVVRP